RGSPRLKATYGKRPLRRADQRCFRTIDSKLENLSRPPVSEIAVSCGFEWRLRQVDARQRDNPERQSAAPSCAFPSTTIFVYRFLRSLGLNRWVGPVLLKQSQNS